MDGRGAELDEWRGARTGTTLYDGRASELQRKSEAGGAGQCNARVGARLSLLQAFLSASDRTHYA